LQNSLGASAAVVAPGVFLMQVSPAEAMDATGVILDEKTRWGLLIDTNKCVEDCDRCVSACNKENGLESTGRNATDAQWIRKITLRDPKTNRSTNLPMMCQHCASPPCVDVCPTGASYKRADGIVLVDKHICIGCRFCMMACPYKARSFVHEPLHNQKAYAPRGKGTVESCTLCVHRVDAGGMPACVEACPNGAMMFGNLNNANSAIRQAIAKQATTQVRADLGLDPGVRYVGI
jgi:molybdopterin-containing oxidoreductase family iron-sulfur binding subunit